MSSSMAGKKIDIMKKAVEVAIDAIPDENSHILVAKFSSNFELLTEKGPLPSSAENKTKIKQKIINLSFDTAQLSNNAINLSFALKECFENEAIAPDAGKMPRSIVVFSNGNFVNQSSVEALLTAPVRTFETRVSAVAIGSGAADSFLRTVVLKGQGIIEVLGVQEHINERMESFMKRLTKPTFRNVRFEALDDSIAQVLPIITPNTTFLKGCPFEIFAYLKNSQDKETNTTALVIHYLDDEDQTEKKINVMLQNKPSPINDDLYKICVSELINTKDELAVLKLDAHLAEMAGANWSVRLSKESNVLSTETSFLAVALDTPPQFFIENDESVFEELDDEGFVAEKTVKVKHMISEDYLTVKKANEIGSTKSAGGKLLNARNFGLKISDMKKKQDTTASTYYSMASKESTESVDNRSQSSMDDIEKPQSIMSQILFEENPEEKDVFKRALSIFQNKMRLPSFDENDENDSFKSNLKPFLSVTNAPRGPHKSHNNSQKGSDDSFQIDDAQGMQAGEEKKDVCKEIIDLQQEKGNWKSDQDILKLISTTMEKISKAVTGTKLDPTLVITLACIQYLTKNFESDSRAIEAIKKAKAYIATTKKIPAAQIPLGLKKVAEIVFPK